MSILTLGLACCCAEMVMASGPTLIHTNEAAKKAGWTWRTEAGHCAVRCPACRTSPDRQDKSALTIMSWCDGAVEIQVSLIE